MNFTQIHERLRQELLRRIQRDTLSVSLLARLSGFTQPHISLFLRSKRQLSLDALDRVLAALHLTVADLLPAPRLHLPLPTDENGDSVPIVSHAAAFSEPLIRGTSAQAMLHLPTGLLQSVRSRTSSPRGSWQRFVAVRVLNSEAKPMEPLVFPNAIALLDRHYNSLAPYRPDRRNLYAVRQGAHLTLRYVEFDSGRLILRPHNLAFPIDLIVVDPDEAPGELLAGRVALILNEF